MRDGIYVSFLSFRSLGSAAVRRQEKAEMTCALADSLPCLRSACQRWEEVHFGNSLGTGGHCPEKLLITINLDSVDDHDLGPGLPVKG